MSFNSQRYLADRERLLEPDSVVVLGNQRRYMKLKKVVHNEQGTLLADIFNRHNDHVRQSEQFKTTPQ